VAHKEKGEKEIKEGKKERTELTSFVMKKLNENKINVNQLSYYLN
jgi:hypothetical protein